MSYQQVDVGRQNQNLLAGTVSQTSHELELRDVGVPVTVINDTYVEYNFFVRQYNDPCNRQGENYLKQVPTSRYLRSLRCKYMIVFIVLALLPFISFLMLLLSIYRFFTLIRIRSIVTNNRRLVSKPFERMIYCAGLTKLNAYIEITSRINYQELSLIGISTETFEIAMGQYRNEVSQGKPIKLMFFNSQFFTYEARVLSDMTMKLIFTVILFAASLAGVIWSFMIISS